MADRRKPKRKLPTIRVVISGDILGAEAVAGELAALMETIGAEVELYIGARQIPQNKEAGATLRARKVIVRLHGDLIGD